MLATVPSAVSSGFAPGCSRGSQAHPTEWHWCRASCIPCLPLRLLSQAGAPHTRDGPRSFCGRDVAKRKEYLRCLLLWDRLKDLGLQVLPAGEHDTYYACVLAAANGSGSHSPPTWPRPGLSVQQYRALLRGDPEPAASLAAQQPSGPIPQEAAAAAVCCPDEEVMLSLGFPASAGPRGRPAPQSQRHLLLDELGPGGLDLVAPGTPALEAAPAAAEDTVAGPEEVAFVPEEPMQGLLQPVQGRPRRQQPGLPHGLPSELGPGLRLQLVQRRQPRGAAEDVGLRITCPAAHAAHVHPRTCCKFRAFSARNCAVAGHAEPAGFLACWAAAASRYPSRAAHMGFEPSAADVAEYLAAAPWAQAGPLLVIASGELLSCPPGGFASPGTHRLSSWCIHRPDPSGGAFCTRPRTSMPPGLHWRVQTPDSRCFPLPGCAHRTPITCQPSCAVVTHGCPCVQSPAKYPSEQCHRERR